METNQAPNNQEIQPNNLKDKFALLMLSNEQKQSLSQKLTEGYKADAAYWTEIVLSSLIAALGLLQNSVAIVIGAMLIAPLFRPIQLVAFGITTGQSRNVLKGLRVLAISSLAAIFIGYLITAVSPLQIETAEILARTNPNVLDLFVALASGVVVFLALNSSRFSESIAGVAMAAALLPPLAVCGIEVALGNWNQAGGSLFLFVTNLVAIIIVGVIIFFLYGYSPNQRLKKINALKDISILIVIIALITVPLIASLQRISEQVSIERKAESFLQNLLETNLPEAKLSELELVRFSKTDADIIGTIKLPEGANLFLETKNSITEELGNELGRNVDLELELIPIASIIAEEQTGNIDYKQELVQNFRSYINEQLPKATIITSDVLNVSTEEREAWTLKSVITIPISDNLSESRQLELNEQFNQSIPDKDIRIIWTILPQAQVETSEPQTPADAHQRELNLKWDNFFAENLPAGFKIEAFEISWETHPEAQSTPESFQVSQVKNYQIKYDLFVNNAERWRLNSLKQAIANFANQELSQEYNIDSRIFTYQTDSF